MYYARPLQILLVALIVLVSCGPDVEPVPPSGGNAGKATDASGFEVETFEGETFSLEEQRGTPVVLNFWESW